MAYAEAHLADLIAAASRGEIVEIDAPIASVQLYASPKTDTNGAAVSTYPLERGSRAHLAGAWEGLLVLPTDEEWATMDEEIARDMLDGPLFPAEHE